jgi:hypothetical protein
MRAFGLSINAPRAGFGRLCGMISVVLVLSALVLLLGIDEQETV